jgi:hypothetical protein
MRDFSNLKSSLTNIDLRQSRIYRKEGAISERIRKMKFATILSCFFLLLQWKVIISVHNLPRQSSTLLNRDSSLHHEESRIDSSLYSRQLFVYGKSAQLRLMNAHVAVIGDDALTKELVKNLALAGVGKVSLFLKESHSIAEVPNLFGEEASYETYIRGLNSNVKVRYFMLTYGFF